MQTLGPFAISEDQFAKMLEASGARGNLVIDPEIAIIRIQDHFNDFQVKHKFKLGDLVRVKQGFNFWKYPETGVPAIVMHIHENPLICNQFSNPPTGYPLDISIGCLYDGELIMCTQNSGFFEPWPVDG